MGDVKISRRFEGTIENKTGNAPGDIKITVDIPRDPTLEESYAIERFIINCGMSIRLLLEKV